MSEITARVGDYNSQLPQVVLKEYGRNIQKIAEFISALPSEEERLSKSKVLIKLMKQLNPKLKDSNDIETKLWHHLHLVANNNLNIGNSANETRKHEMLPDRVPYLSKNVKSKHFGVNIQRVAEATCHIEDPKEKEEAIVYLGKLMKRYYQFWHGDRLEDEIVVEQISSMTNGKLQVSLSKVKEEQLFYVDLKDSLARNTPRANSSTNYKRNKNNNGRNNDKRRRR